MRSGAHPAQQQWPELAPSSSEARALCEEADRDGLVLVTTEKDAARMERDPNLAELLSRAHALPVTLALDDEAGFRALMMERIARARARTG